MAKASESPGLDAVVTEIEIAAPVERVFQALTDSAQLIRWWGDEACKPSVWEIDARLGGEWHFEASDSTEKLAINGVSHFKAHGEIVEYDPPRILAYIWLANWHEHPDHPTLVRWELVPSASGTRVKVTHTGLTDERVARQDYTGGWPGVLELLRTHCERAVKASAVAIAVSPDQDSLVGEVFIAVPPDRVFQAITDPQQLLKWWGQKGLYRCTEWEADLKPGGRWRSAGVNESGARFEVKGEYLEIDRPHLLVHTWLASWAGDLESTVRWELTAAPGGTLVKMRHSGLAGKPEALKSFSGGWPRVLAWAQSFLERGEAVETRQPLSMG